jgi:hypothetical protein
VHSSGIEHVCEGGGTEMGSTTTEMRADGFVAALLAGLALRDVEALSIRGTEFDSAAKRVFDILRYKHAPTYSIDLRFRVYLDKIYGDSPVIREALSQAAQSDLIALDDPEYQNLRIKLNCKEAELLAAQLPGGVVLAEALADEFLSDYAWVVRKHVRSGQ